MLRVAAGLSFGLCFAGGLWIFSLAATHWGDPDAAPIAALGLILMGLAVFAGAIIWWAAEKLCSRNHGKGEQNPKLPI